MQEKDFCDQSIPYRLEKNAKAPRQAADALQGSPPSDCAHFVQINV